MVIFYSYVKLPEGNLVSFWYVENKHLILIVGPIWAQDPSN